VFLGDFLANFASDFLIGAVVAGLLAWWIGRKLDDSQAREQHRREQRSNLEKAVMYLSLVGEEIETKLDEMPNLIEELERPGSNEVLEIRKSLIWDALQPGGELPKLLDTELLAALARFYERSAFAQRCNDLDLESWMSTRIPRPSYAHLTSKGLREALAYGEHLPIRIEQEIGALQSKIKRL